MQSAKADISEDKTAHMAVKDFIVWTSAAETPEMVWTSTKLLSADPLMDADWFVMFASAGRLTAEPSAVIKSSMVAKTACTAHIKNLRPCWDTKQKIHGAGDAWRGMDKT